MNTDWMADANCKGMDISLFFLERGQKATEARRVCSNCSVARECLSYALSMEDGQMGFWGGMSENERWNLISEAKRRNIKRGL